VAASFQLAEVTGKLKTCRHSHLEIIMAQHHSPAFLKIVDDARKRIRELTVDDVKAKLDRGEKFHLVDVREDSEWAADHVAGAIHLGKGVIERDAEQRLPDKTAEIILYCGGGFRSALAADNLQKMGYTNVYSMDGGIRGWREKKYPLSKGS
jgi:rhodanese-related sulfurtransferase